MNLLINFRTWWKSFPDHNIKLLSNSTKNKQTNKQTLQCNIPSPLTLVKVNLYHFTIGVLGKNSQENGKVETIVHWKELWYFEVCPEAFGWLSISKSSIHAPFFQRILQENIRPSVTQLKCKGVSWSKAVIYENKFLRQWMGKNVSSVFWKLYVVHRNVQQELKWSVHARILQTLQSWSYLLWVRYLTQWCVGHQLYSKKYLVANIADLLKKGKEQIWQITGKRVFFLGLTLLWKRPSSFLCCTCTYCSSPVVYAA